MVARLSQQAGIPTPRVCVTPQEAPNAFATGRNPSHAAVAATEGILRVLSEHELEGVIAHELAHAVQDANVDLDAHAGNRPAAAAKSWGARDWRPARGRTAPA